MTTDGSRIWVACGTDGVYVSNQGAVVWQAAAKPARLAQVTGLIGTYATSGPVGNHLAASEEYTYGVTAVDSFGNETNLGPDSHIYRKSPAAIAPITLSWAGNPLATSFNVYRKEDGANWGFLGNVAAAAPTWVDDGRVEPVYKLPPSSNNTGSSSYAASFISYCSGYLIGSTGPDLVNILANGTAQFIYEHNSPAFQFTFAFATPTAIHVGGSANGQSFIGAIQPDSATQGANLAPPYTATTLPVGEVPHAIAYNAGSIIMATSAGVRTGTAPDSTGVFDINAAIIDAAPVLCLAAFGNYCYYGWTNYEQAFDQPGIPDPDVFTNFYQGASGLGKLDLSQYTALGIPAYATDAMVPDADGAAGAIGSVTSVTIINGLPYFSVQGAGIYGPTNGKYVPNGWMEVGWTRYSTQEDKILTLGTYLPLVGP
jgi:hypothetical protein